MVMKQLVSRHDGEREVLQSRPWRPWEEKGATKEEIVQMLLEKGADINAQTGQNRNALQVASRILHFAGGRTEADVRCAVAD